MKTKTNSIIILIACCCLRLSELKAQSTPYYFGEFKVRKIIIHYDTSGSIVNFHATAVVFSDSTAANYSPFAGSFGTVYFNETGLGYNENIKLYFDTIQRHTLDTVCWIFDSSQLTSFTTSCQDSFPSMNIEALSLDTITKSDSLYIQFENVTHTDRIELNIWDGVNRVEFPFNRRLSGNQTSVSIPATDLDTLDGETVSVRISLIKEEYKVFNSVRYKFEKQFDIVRNVPLIQ